MTCAGSIVPIGGGALSLSRRLSLVCKSLLSRAVVASPLGESNVEARKRSDFARQAKAPYKTIALSPPSDATVYREVLLGYNPRDTRFSGTGSKSH